MFKDSDHAWNPTAEEIRTWAYSDALIPEQDWELAVNSFENIPMICSFVDDEKCKHISFFLSCLYVFTGDFVRSSKNDEYNKLIELLNRIEIIAKSEELIAWIKRSRDLILNPDKYDYRFWGLESEYVYKVKD